MCFSDWLLRKSWRRGCHRRNYSRRWVLANLCVDWESHLKSVEAIGIRVINARFGLILSPRGGILKPLTFASYLKTGIGFGKGTNVINWVTIEDVIGCILYVIGNTNIRGPINVVSPNPVKASDFFK